MKLDHAGIAQLCMELSDLYRKQRGGGELSAFYYREAKYHRSLAA